MIGARRAFGIFLLTDEQIEIANQNGINEATLNARLSKKPIWDLERALNTPVRKIKRLEVTWTEQDIKEAEENGTCRDLFIRRIREGKTIQEAKSTPPGIRKVWMIGTHTLTGKQMKKAVELGLKKVTVRNRIESLDWDVDKAVSKKPIRHETEWTKEDLLEAEENGIARTTFKARVRELGYPVKKAKTKPVLKTGRGSRK